MSEDQERNTISIVLSDTVEPIWNSIERNYKTKTVEKLLQIWDEAGRPSLLKFNTKKEDDEYETMSEA